MKKTFINKHYFTILLMTVLLSSCLENEDTELEKQAKFEDELISQHLEDNNITAIKDNTGIYYQVLEENPSGTPVEQEDIVSIRYVMRTLGGKLIDSLEVSEEQDTVVRFQHVSGALFPDGINQGVRLMNVGEKFRLYIPSYRAFSNYSYKTLLPSEAILNIEVEVVKVESADDILDEEETAIENYIAENQLEGVSKKSSGIYYQVIEEGSGDVVKNGELVEVSYKGMFLNNEVFDQSESGKPISFRIGNNNIIEGFREGVALMKKGEKGRIFIPSKYAYNNTSQVIPGVIRKDFMKTYQLNDMPPFQTLIFEVELEDIN